ncbi:MAG: SUMF1/EgtB/PvdO family nonheme iron enzyme [Deltaproteobacteria bacterium]|nr:SUMF1/EgtB/PvdO family nonheme iron enzyme [Deltaproteobacteria bacterium]
MANKRRLWAGWGCAAALALSAGCVGEADKGEDSAGADDGAADGAADGATDGADGATNGAPTTPIIQLWPGDATTDDALYVEVAGGAEDPDGDAVTILYVWSRDGEVQPAWTEDLVPPSATTKGERWSVEVSATDGINVSEGVVAEVIIGNAAPSAPGVALLPAAPTPGEALECAVLSPSVDPDGDPLTYTVHWQVNGVDFDGAVDGTWPGDTVPLRVTAAGEEWTCAVRASDGEATGEQSTASAVVALPCGSGGVSLSAGGVDFVELCASTFDVGCTPGQFDCNADESPTRPVTLSYDYLLGQTEVTQGQFEALMGYNPSNNTSCGASCPVETLSWHEGAAFANAVSALEGLESCYACRGSGSSVICAVEVDPVSCEGYRLPTEAEWEGAARCGEDLPFSGSATASAVGWVGDAEAGATQPVGARAGTSCGTYDMTGNVWEMTQDWYDSAAYASGPVDDPTGPATGTDRVARGGSWSAEAYRSRVSSRGVIPPSDRFADLGLRLARTAP